MSLDKDVRDAFERHAGDVTPGADAWSGIRTRIERNHRRRLIAAAFVAGAVVASIAIGVPQLASSPAPPIAPDVTRPLPEAIPQFVAKTRFDAAAMATGSDAIWAISKGRELGARGTLARIDPRTNRVMQQIAVGFDPIAVAVGDGSVWVVNGKGCGDELDRPCAPGFTAPARPSDDEQSIWRIDERTLEVEAKLRVGLSYDIVVTKEAAWYTVGGAGVQAIDLRRNEIISESAILVPGEGIVRLAVGFDRMWAVTEETSAGHAFLTVIDPARRDIVKSYELPAAGMPADVAAGSGGVWATTMGTTTPSALMRVDSLAQETPRIIELPDAAPVGLTAVTTGYGYVWATSARGYLWKVDPATNRPTIEPLLIGATPPVAAADVVTGFGSIWVASGDGEIWRFDP